MRGDRLVRALPSDGNMTIQEAAEAAMIVSESKNIPYRMPHFVESE